MKQEEGRDPNKQPFAWQEKHILRLLKKTFKGTELSRYLLLYNTLSWLHSDFNGKPIKYFTKTIHTYSGLSKRFIPEGIKTFQEFKIVKIRGIKEDGLFITKELTFTPEVVKQGTKHFSNCHKSTIVEKAALIEHSHKNISKEVSLDISTTPTVIEDTYKKKKVPSSVRMDNAAEFLTQDSKASRIYDKVVQLTKEANSRCKRSPAFSVPRSSATKYLKTLGKQIKLLQAGKFKDNYIWTDFFKDKKFPGEELEGASDEEVWEMIEFAMMKYVRIRDNTKYVFYGNREMKINLSEFMFISYQALKNPKETEAITDGYSRFWQFLLPVTRNVESTTEFEENIKKLYKKSSSDLGRQVYNHYETLKTSEKIRFCKSMIAVGNYFKKHKKNILRNNGSAVILLRTRKDLFEYYVKWVKQSGFEHVPSVFPGNDGRWIDFVNWLKDNYGVNLKAIKDPKPKKKAEVWVEPEMSEDEAYDRSILGSLYDLLDPHERLAKLKLWFKAQHDEEMEAMHGQAV